MTTLISQLVWQNDLMSLEKLLMKLKNNDPEVDFIPSIDDWDVRGNPPLHLALMLGRKEAARILLEYGASPTSVNSLNWDAVDEAVRLGDRELLSQIYQQYFTEEIQGLIEHDGPWHKMNTSLPEVYLELEIKLKSPVPVIERICPREVVKVWKKRNALRIDWSISKIQGFKIARAEMSFIAKINQDKSVDAFVVNRDENVYEKICPRLSRSILHDIVDSFLRDGIVSDEIPLATFELKRATNTMGGAKSSHIRANNCDTEVFKFTNLSCKQRYYQPIVTPMPFDMCTDQCRTVRVVEHVKHVKEVFGKPSNKVENLKALQFISESDLACENEEDEEDFCEKEMAKASQAFKTNKIVTAEDVSLVNNAVKGFMEKAGKIASKHLRSFSRSTVFRSRSKTTENDNISIRERSQTSHSTKFLDKDMKDMTLEESEYMRVHIKSFPPPEVTVSADEYFAGGSNRLTLGREWKQGTSSYYRDKPMTIYKATTFPISAYDILPLLEWLLRKSIQPVELTKFVDSHFSTGFPVRVVIPIFAMLELKLTILKAEKKVSLSEIEFELPKNAKEGEIFPLVEID